MGFSDFKHSDNGDNYLERKDLFEGLRLANRYIRKGLCIVNKPFIDEVIVLCIDSHRFKAAMHLIMPLLEIFPADAELLYADAICNFRLHKPDAAALSVFHALQIDPTKQEYLLLAGEVCLTINKPETALHYFQLLTEYQAGDAEVLYEVSKILLSYNRVEQSLMYVQQAKELDGDNLAIIFHEALCFESAARYSEALGAYDTYLFKKSNCPIGWYNRGLVLQRMDRLPEALQSCSFAYSLNDMFTEALFTVANLHADLNQITKSIECFEKLAVIEPGNAYTYYNLGAIYMDECKYEKAIYNYTRFLEINPESTDAYNARGYCFLKTNALEDALSDMRSAILYEVPMVGRLRLNQPSVIRNKQKFLSRIKKLKVLTKYDPKTHISRLIDTLLILRKHNEAIKIARHYANNGIDKTFSLALLAKIYFILGNTILGYAMLSQAAPASSDLFNNVKCLMPKTGVSKLFFTLFGITKDLTN